MKTKEEILTGCLRIKEKYSQIRFWDTEVVRKAMDSYAEQMAIGFAEWVGKNALFLENYWDYEFGTKTTKELYQLYLKSIEK